MIVVDTSVVVAAFASWHERHAPAREAVDAGARIAQHTAFEAYSVLTRLPAPHRAPAEVVGDFLRSRFPPTWLTLRPVAAVALLSRLASAGIAGGATHDAIIAATAASAGATLLTCDERARRTYEVVGVTLRLLH